MIEIRIRDRDYPGYKSTNKPVFRMVARRGKMFGIGSETVELFGIKVFAECMDRTTNWCIAHEKAGDIPKPLYEMEHNAHNFPHPTRYYSAAQIVNCNNMFIFKYKSRRILHKTFKETNDIRKPFFDDVRKLWFERDVIPVDEFKEIEIEHEDVAEDVSYGWGQ